MKRSAVLTVLLYALALVLLIMPVVLAAFANWGKDDSNIGLNKTFQLYLHWGYWLWLAVLVAGQTAGSCAAASSNCSLPCRATSSSAAATTAAHRSAPSGASPPAFPSCCSVSAPA